MFPVSARISTDDLEKDFLIADVRDFLASLTDQQAIKLHNIEYCGDYESDEVYHYYLHLKDPRALEIEAHCADDHCGYEVEINSEQAFAYFQETRPHLAFN